MYLLGPVMALLALLSLGCFAVRNKRGQIPSLNLAMGVFFAVGAGACLYLIIFGG